MRRSQDSTLGAGLATKSTLMKLTRALFSA